MEDTKSKYKFDIHREDLYIFYKPDLKDRTKKRLIEIAELGMEEIGIASFGIKGIMSGLHIEKVWHYSDEDFLKYINWVKELIRDKTVSPGEVL